MALEMRATTGSMDPSSETPTLRVNNLNLRMAFPLESMEMVPGGEEAETLLFKKNALHGKKGFYVTGTIGGGDNRRLLEQIKFREPPKLAMDSSLEVLWNAQEGDELSVFEPLFQAVSREMKGLGKKIANGCVSDVRIRDEQEEAAADPFKNFHVDVPVLSQFFIWSFAKTFGGRYIPDDCAHKARKLLEIESDSQLTLNQLINNKKVREICDTDGFLYGVQQRCNELMGNATSSTVGGQINCWWQLNEEPCVQPTLGFFTRRVTPKLFSAVELQDDYFSDMACPRVFSKIEQLLKLEKVHYFPEISLGRCFVWDAQTVLHSAFCVNNIEGERSGQERKSLEIRWTTLNLKEVDGYIRAIVQELSEYTP